MKIVVDINHPAHVHFFKNFILAMERRGHRVMVTASEKDIALELLRIYGIPHKNLGSYGRSKLAKLANILVMDWKMYRAVKKFQPDVLMGIASVRAAHVGFLCKKPAVIFDDTDHKSGFGLYVPFADRVLTPECFRKDLGPKQVRYSGYHELAYLHPRRFRPREIVLKGAGLKRGDRFFIVRFVSWAAGHDIGQKGLDYKIKKSLIENLSSHGQVILTSEGKVPEEFKQYQINVPPDKIHDLLYFASAYIGEGATMASEAAMLGTPAIFTSSIDAGTLLEQEKKYHLLTHCRNSSQVLRKTKELLRGIKSDRKAKRDTMLKEKIDTTDFMIKYIETNYAQKK